MAQWIVQEVVECTKRGALTERRSFRVAPEEEPDQWVIETNDRLSCEMQKETAQIIAYLLSTFLGA